MLAHCRRSYTVYLDADEVESCHSSEELIVVEPPGQINIEVLEHLDTHIGTRAEPSSTKNEIIVYSVYIMLSTVRNVLNVHHNHSARLTTTLVTRSTRSHRVSEFSFCTV